MALNKREMVIENLAVATALGFLAMIVAALSLAVDSRVVAEELAILIPAGAEAAVAGRADNPSLDRVYLIKTDAGPSYAAVVALRSPSGAALVGARFTPKGGLQDLRFLGSCASRLPPSARELVAEFPGAEDILGYAAEFSRRLAAGTSDGRL